MVIYVMVNMVRYGMGIVWYGSWYSIIYSVWYGFIYQLNHDHMLCAFEDLNHNSDKFMSKKP